MRSSTFNRLLVVISAVCAGTLVNGLGFNLQADQDEGWPPLFRRNVAHIIEKRGKGATGKAEMDNLDMVEWSTDTVKACAAKLNSTTDSGNPTGLLGCWNIAGLVLQNGFFSADLRLFRVSPAQAEWAKLPIDAYQVRVVYDEMTAVISPRPMEPGEEAASNAAMASISNTNLTKEVDAQFIGSLYPASLAKPLTDEDLKVLVTPKIYVEATTPEGIVLKTPISISHAQYINGLFSQTADLTPEQAEAVKKMPFVLPGTHIAVTPVGLYFFSSYLLISCAIFVFGTFERAKFRSEYRKRIAGQL